MPTEHPILFSGAMVRAILGGTKTQTRRVIRLPRHIDPHHCMVLGGAYYPHSTIVHWPGDDGIEERMPRCPYGAPGDRLWVRETATRSGGYMQYLADHTTSAHLWPPTWKQDPRPSIFMPRASRWS